MTKLFAVLGWLAAALAVAGTYAPAEDKKAAPPSATGVDPRMTQFLECARACQDCARVCDMCGAHCARMIADGKKEHLITLAACADCASVCTSAAGVTARNGPFSDLICTACADACKRCGDACEKHGTDAIMKQCADECRRCEKACRDMLKQSPKPQK
jgi:hypothetical protein